MQTNTNNVVKTCGLLQTTVYMYIVGKYVIHLYIIEKYIIYLYEL